MKTLTQRRLAKVINTHDMREQAKRLPKAVFDAIDGGASDEITVRANAAEYQRISLRPRILTDVSGLDTSTTVLGQRVNMPLLLAPCGFALMTNHEAELPAVRAAGAAGTTFVVSGAGTKSLEEISRLASGPLWYQLYLPPERSAGAAIIDRAEAAGYEVLCVTVDSAVNGKRERDYRNHLTMPLKMSPNLLWTGLRNPVWTANFIRGGAGRGRGITGSRQVVGRFAEVVSTAKPVTLDDLVWIRNRWRGKLVVKGVQRAEEVEQIVSVGAEAVVVSNHGGRNLDTVRPTVRILPEVVAAAAGRVEVLLDGGIRRGSDVVKALALGATACLVGRPYMFGLGVGGEAGVARVLQIFQTEISQTMANLGCETVRDIDPSVIDQQLWARAVRDCVSASID